MMRGSFGLTVQQQLMTSAAAIFMIASASPAMAQTRTFDVPAGSAAKTIPELGRQAGIQILAGGDDVKGKRTNLVRGTYTVSEALEILLRGTGLKAEPAQNGIVTVRASTVGNGGDNASSTGEAIAQNEEGIADILVVGNRTQNVDIPRTEDDAQHYVVFNSNDIKASGATNVEDFLKKNVTMNTLAIQNNLVDPTQLRGSTNSAINLRGLGTNETLVLVNGRRMAGVSIQNTGYQDQGRSQPDVNGIPLEAIDRIEILPSSASAIYGGAAVGGVVNIILKKDYSGGTIAVSLKHPTSTDSWSREISGSYGFASADNLTRVFISGSYQKNEPILLGDRRDLVERGIAAIAQNRPAAFRGLTPFPGATTNISSLSGALRLDNGTLLPSTITFVPTGAAPGADISSALISNAGSYNLNVGDHTGPYGLQRPIGTTATLKNLSGTIRRTAFGSGELFLDYSISENNGATFRNPFSAQWVVSGAAPTNPFTQTVFVSFPATVRAPNRSKSETQVLSTGAIFPIISNWRGELDYTWSRNNFESKSFGVDNTAFNSALNSGAVNPFVDTLANPLSLDRFLGTYNLSGSSTVRDLAGRASGSIGSLPGGRPKVTVGLGVRKEGVGDTDTRFDMPITTTASQHFLYFGQEQTVKSAYVEALLPFISERNGIWGIKSLDIQIAARSEWFNVRFGLPYQVLAPVSGATPAPTAADTKEVKYSSLNPTIAVRYRPTASVTLRGSYARAFLPPTGGQLVLNSGPDGCGLCTQIVDPKNGQTYYVAQITGGNPNLQPQRSISWTFGAIFEPTRGPLAGLRGNVEYYNIVQPNYILSPTAQLIVSDPNYSDRVTRDSTTGLITLVNTSFINALKYATQGIDFSIDYSRATPIGTVSVHGAGTRIIHDKRQYAVNGPLLEYAGFPNDGGELKFKANGSFSLQNGPWSGAWSTFYYPQYEQTGAPGSPGLLLNNIQQTWIAQGQKKIRSQIYHDFFIRYVFGGSDAASGKSGGALRGMEISLQVENVVNKRPPFDAGVAPFYSSLLNGLGLRTFRIALRKSF